MSVFKPVLMDAALPAHGPRPTDQFDARTLWWRHERLHRAALMDDFGNFVEAIREERDALEADFRTRVTNVLNGGSAAERSHVIAECWKEAMELEGRWRALINKTPSLSDTPYYAAWSKMSRLAGLEADF
jgi:hypothetical protein